MSVRLLGIKRNILRFPSSTPPSFRRWIRLPSYPSPSNSESRTMKVAVEGCCHGELDNIYKTIDVAVAKTGIEVPDVLICCGDFQSFRNRSDLQTFAAPAKYRQLGSFWKYYNGEKVAPILTIFVGGNHEASGYLWELYHGGWVAPNIYFLGFAGSVILKKELPDGSTDSIRISGASGIFKKHDYRTGHHERLPFDNSTIRSIYHVREYDTFRLSRLPVSSCDVFVSHDWPVGIEQYGKTAQLLRAKPFFREEVTTNTLGSPPLMQLLQTIKPSYWFSAHLHVKFAAMYQHGQQSEVLRPELAATPKVTLNPDEVPIEDDEDGDEEPASTSLVDGKSSSVNPDMIAIDDSDEDDTINEATPSTQLAPALTHEPQGQARCGSGEQVMAQPIDQKDVSGCEKAEVNPDPVVPECANNAAPAKTTRFLALDKCLPRKDFLQILDIPAKHNALHLRRQSPNTAAQIASPSTLPLPSGVEVSLTQSVNKKQDPKTASSTARLFFDPDWLAITRAFHDHLPLRKYDNKKLPTDPELIQKMVDQEKEWVAQNLAPELLEISNVQQFVKTAPGIGDQGGDRTGPPFWYTNPQTLAFTDLLQIKNKINPPQED